MIKAVFFDMNETMLNLGLLKKNFDKYFDDKYVLKYWFTKLLHTSTVIGSTDEYKNFGELASIVLEGLFYENNMELTKEIKDEVLGSFRSLPVYDDVPKALKFLKKKGIKVIALSNSSLKMIEEQLSNAGILELFDGYYSVDSVKKYKPFKDIYEYVANEEKISVENIVMVASHDWDLFGAKKVGFTTGYIKRKKEIYNPYYYQPNLVDTDLLDLAKQIIKIK